MADAPIRYAKSISSSACAHGSLFVHFHGEDGEIFATASMDVTTGAEFLDSFATNCEAVVDLIRSGRVEPGPELH